MITTTQSLEIYEYDAVEPLAVLELNLLSLSYALTPQRVALIRQLDARPFPFFALYAVEDSILAGQVAVYRLPVMTLDGPQEVGGASAVCTHPAFSGRGIATALLEEAHRRMRLVGLRFSTLGTSRFRLAHRLYHNIGYEDVLPTQSIFLPVQEALIPTRLRATPATPEGLHLADELYASVTPGRLGFSRRPRPFIPSIVAIGDLALEEVWLIWDGDELAGYAFARVSQALLEVNHLLLVAGADPAEAVASLAQAQPVSYLLLRLSHPPVLESLRRLGYPPPRPDWGTFMVKPLEPGLTAADFSRLCTVGTEQFMISPIDIT